MPPWSMLRNGLQQCDARKAAYPKRQSPDYTLTGLRARAKWGPTSDGQSLMMMGMRKLSLARESQPPRQVYPRRD